jgi:hypothetical protein
VSACLSMSGEDNTKKGVWGASAVQHPPFSCVWNTLLHTHIHVTETVVPELFEHLNAGSLGKAQCPTASLDRW